MGISSNIINKTERNTPLRI